MKNSFTIVVIPNHDDLTCLLFDAIHLSKRIEATIQFTINKFVFNVNQNSHVKNLLEDYQLFLGG